MAWQRNETADQAERDVADYLKVLGWYLVPAINFGHERAPMVEGQSPIIMPDAIGIRAGEMAAFEIKWKSKAVPRHNFGCAKGEYTPGRGCSLGVACGGRRYTGVDLESYRHYRNFQAEAQRDVFIVFLHERENEVRIGSLTHLETSCHHPKLDGAVEQYGKGGMRNWFYDQIPLWMPYSEMKSFVAELRRTGRAPHPPQIRSGAIARDDTVISASAPRPIPKPTQTTLSFIDPAVRIEDLDRGLGLHAHEGRRGSRR